MTHEELTHLPPAQLIELVLQQQVETARLQSRLAELETRLPSALPTQNENGVTQPTTASPLPSVATRHHRRNRHRPWHKRLWGWFFPRELRVRKYLAIILLMLLLSLVIGWLVAVNMSRRPSEPAPSGYFTDPSPAAFRPANCAGSPLRSDNPKPVVSHALSVVEGEVEPSAIRNPKSEIVEGSTLGTPPIL